MLIDPNTLARRELNELVVGLVGPRPIAWVSTVAEDGSRNLAPFSFFNAFCFDPPVLAVGPGMRSGVEKDSLRNLRASGEFTVSVVTEELAERANLSGGDFGPGVDEWTLAGVEPAPSVDVRPPRVAESPAAFECRVRQIVDLGTERAPANALVLGQVTRIHVAEDVLDGLTPLPDRLRLVGRMGGAAWCTTRDRFDLVRPRGEELERLVSGARARRGAEARRAGR
jgi:flavin reductase (DIM6/NTAB) family NADH-FMN oxidoreductase RutF